MNQYILEGKKLNERYRIDTNLFGDKTLTIPLNAFLKDDRDNNYLQVKKAFRRLKNKEINYEDDKRWACLSIIANPIIDKYASCVTFHINHMIYDALLNFSKGYRKYELDTAMQFESVYAMRFYELMSGQKKPIEFKIEYLKEIFAITGKYKKVNDFKKYVLDIAKKELDKCSPYTFDYKMQKTGRSFTSVRFFPKYQPKYRAEEAETKMLQKQIPLSYSLSKNVLDYLKTAFEFESKEIMQNLDFFKKAEEKIENFIDFMAQVKPRANRANNPKGYLINSIKNEL